MDEFLVPDCITIQFKIQATDIHIIVKMYSGPHNKSFRNKTLKPNLCTEICKGWERNQGACLL